MYVQQIGRAGRGDQGARVTLMINKSDIGNNVKGLTTEMRHNCTTTVCKRKFLCIFFGYEMLSEVTDCCSNCNEISFESQAVGPKPKNSESDINTAVVAQALLSDQSMDRKIQEQLSITAIQEITNSYRDINSPTEIANQFGVEEYVANSIVAIIKSIRSKY